MDRYFVFGETLSLCAGATLARPLFSELFSSFSFGMSRVRWQEGEALCVYTPGTQIPSLGETEEFILHIGEDGIAMRARDAGALARAMSVFLSRIEAPAPHAPHLLRMQTAQVRARYRIGVRMAHICIFPEDSLRDVQRMIRLFGVLGYTHLCVEFWGTLQMDSFPAFAWQDRSFTKEEIRPLLAEGEALGMEMIPMLNMLGHASAARVIGGKHVVLDQRPDLAPLFTPDGWCWNIQNPEVAPLLRAMREELCALFPHAHFFHCGCDEAYTFSKGYVTVRELSDWLAGLTREIVAAGMRPILWDDMFVPKSESAEGLGTDADTANSVLSALDRATICADWQYEATDIPVRTATYIQAQGFDVLGCPWFEEKNILAYTGTCGSAGLYGLMLTTWHTLHLHPESALIAARACGAPETPWSRYSHARIETAALQRKILPAAGVYEDSGFCPSQIDRHLKG